MTKLHDKSMPDKCLNTPAAALWERQGPMTEPDDGCGLFDYCKYGNSNCLDSFCDCTPSFSNRISYLAARGNKNPLRYLLVVVTSPLIVLTLIGAGLYWWFG